MQKTILAILAALALTACGTIPENVIPATEIPTLQAQLNASINITITGDLNNSGTLTATVKNALLPQSGAPVTAVVTGVNVSILNIGDSFANITGQQQFALVLDNSVADADADILFTTTIDSITHTATIHVHKSVPPPAITTTLTITNTTATTELLTPIDSQTELLVCFQNVFDTAGNLAISGVSSTPDNFTTAIMTTNNAINTTKYSSIAYLSGVATSNCIAIDTTTAWSSSFPVGSSMSMNVSGVTSSTITGAWFVTPSVAVGKRVFSFAPITPNSVTTTPVGSQQIYNVNQYFNISAI